jgi:SNF2 family DNA or RNA helicase
MILRDYQIKARDFLVNNNKAMILAPVGAGKTALTLSAMELALKQKIVKRWLVLGPKRVCIDVWPTEQNKWARNTSLSVAVGTPKQRIKALESNAPIVVTNYESIPWIVENILSFDGIVFDELTKLKNSSGKRFKLLLKAINKINIRWGLTGSFTSNGLEDIFGQCKIINQTLLGPFKTTFLQQYFILINRDYGEWAPRPGSLELVMQRIKPATFLLEANKYTDKLPACNLVKMNCVLEDYKPYTSMKKQFVADFKTEQITALTAATVTSKLQQMAGGWVYNNQKDKSPIWFSKHKLDCLNSILEENQHDNTIIVYNYIAELDELKHHYPNACTINDDNAVDRWNNGEIEILLIHPKSAGHGLNLQYGGNKMIFLSLPWSLELYEQTVGRIHRSGQKKDAWVYLLLTENTIDTRIYDALQQKRTISDIAINELK